MKEANLFIKMLYDEQVSFEDIKTFCEQKMHEKERVEYKGWLHNPDKERMSESILESIVAMANTDGGLIFVGVSEEKDRAGGGRRGYPDQPTGMPVQDANGLKQSIDDKALTRIEPPYCPDIKLIPTSQSGNEVIILIRIDSDAIERHLIFRFENGKMKGPLVRISERPVLPTWEQIIDMAQARANDQDSVKNQQLMSLSHFSCSCEPFWCCALAVMLRKRRFQEQPTWDETDKESIIEYVENYYPKKSKQSFGIFREWLHPDYTRNEFNPCISIDSSLDRVIFQPDTQKKFEEMSTWYKVYIDSAGIMMATIAISKRERSTVTADVVLTIIYTLLDLE